MARLLDGAKREYYEVNTGAFVLQTGTTSWWIVKMEAIEAKIKYVLEDKGIRCRSVYSIPDPDDPRVLLAFNSKDNQRLTPSKVQRALNSLGAGEFSVSRDFQRLSAAFLHLEVRLGARTETPISRVAK